MLHHQAGEADRIFDVLHRSNGSRFESLAVHDRGIELVGSLVREDRALPRVEERIVLEHHENALHSIEARAVSPENLIPRVEGFKELVLVLFLKLRSHLALQDRSSSAVNDEAGSDDRSAFL